MPELFRLPAAAGRDPAVDAWMEAQPEALRAIAQPWFACMRACGDDVRELLHDGRPTACVADAAFAYVDAFAAHVNVGFFQGAALPDPEQLLLGTGKRMRHVKLRPGSDVDVAALEMLVRAAYVDLKKRMEAER